MNAMSNEADIVERLRSSEPLPVCPYDRLSPHYWTAPDDKPCAICGQENTTEGPDKCRGADTRIMGEAADMITKLRADRDTARADALRSMCEVNDLRFERDAAARDMRERCAKVAEAKREVFLSPQYATGQPMSSAGERFACTQIADEIRALPDASGDQQP